MTNISVGFFWHRLLGRDAVLSRKIYHNVNARLPFVARMPCKIPGVQSRHLQYHKSSGECLHFPNGRLPGLAKAIRTGTALMSNVTVYISYGICVAHSDHKHKSQCTGGTSPPNKELWGARCLQAAMSAATTTAEHT